MWWTSCFFVHLSHQSIAILSDFEVKDRRGKTKRKEKTYLIVLSVSCLLVFRVSQMVLQTPNLLGFQTTAVLLTSDLLFPSPLSLRFSGASFCIDLLQPSSLSSGRSSFMHVPRIKGPWTSPPGYRQHGSWLAIKGGQSYLLITVLSAPPEHQRGFSMCQRNLPKSATEEVSLRVSPLKALLLKSKAGVSLTLAPCPRVEGRTHSKAFSI